MRSLFGIPVVLDANIPPDELHFKRGKRLLGGIVGIAAEPGAGDNSGSWLDRVDALLATEEQR